MTGQLFVDVTIHLWSDLLHLPSGGTPRAEICYCTSRSVAKFLVRREVFQLPKTAIAPPEAFEIF